MMPRGYLITTWCGHGRSRSSMIGHINLEVKCTGARSAGDPHAACDVAGVGNGATE